MTPFSLTPTQWRNAFSLGVVAALAYLGLRFGAEVYRCRAMALAAAEVAECQTEDECIVAYERLEKLEKLKRSR